MTVFETGISFRHVHTQRTSFAHRAKAAMQAISAALIALQEWQARARERRQLRGFSDAALKDFGANRAIAEREGSKPFWMA